MEGSPPDGAAAGRGEATGKAEEEGPNPLAPAASCGGKGAEPPAAAMPPSPAAESPGGGGVALKVAATVLHPVCLGDGPLMLPIHLQMAGAAAGTQLGQMGAAAAPYLLSSQSPVSLPLVLDQQVLQHMGPSGIPQSGVLCQNPFGLTAGDHKSAGQTQDANLLSLLQNPAFAAILQDLFPSTPTGASACQSPGSTFFPLPPLAPPYASPLAPLVPPATLLVPYPVIIPLPVPLPVPLPIPVPAPQAEDSKGNMPKPVCTASKSTQTSPKDTTSPPLSSRQYVPSLPLPPRASPSSLPAATAIDDGQALDLSVRACLPVVPKQEYPSPQQDDVLDLSVPAAARRKCVQSGREVSFRAGPDGDGGASLSLGIDSKLLGSLASLEFSRQHKWVVDSTAGGSGSPSQPCGGSSGGGNLEIVSASQTAKVIVSVKDAIPAAILCGKIKGLSGVSTKNFSIKRDGSQAAAAAAAALQQLYGVPAAAAASHHGEQHDPNNPHKKLPKSRAIKLKKVSTQEIHFLPLKKQRLAALLPRK
ncbi:retinoic acid-induced protein 2 [Clinocottus analis]|uniref:retinoic acid-induced protein 2 n=1 Tax=Clinocottus analis TaxID=304258 RepID=UPI0035BFD7FA